MKAKRLVSVLLALSMMLTLLPVSAFADADPTPPSVPLVIQEDGNPDTTGITPTKNSNGQSVYDAADWCFTEGVTGASYPYYMSTLELKDTFNGEIGPHTQKGVLKNYGILTGGANRSGYSQGNGYYGLVSNHGTISGGTYFNQFTNEGGPSNPGIVTDGLFYVLTYNYGTIEGGIFLCPFYNYGTVTSGIFSHDPRVNEYNASHVPPTEPTYKVTVEGGKITAFDSYELAENISPLTEIYVVGSKAGTLKLAFDNNTEKTLTLPLTEDIVITLEDTTPSKPEQPSTPETPETPAEKTYTLKLDGATATDADGNNILADTPVKKDTKITLKLTNEKQGEMVFDYWNVTNADNGKKVELVGFKASDPGASFEMPAQNLVISAQYRDPNQEAQDDDSFLLTAAAVTGGAVLTGLVVWQGYNIFANVYMKAVLPENTAIPATRGQLALLLWNEAGCPEPSAAEYLYPDVSNEDTQKAAKWTTENELFSAREDGTFAPEDSVSIGQVFRAWRKLHKAIAQ